VYILTKYVKIVTMEVFMKTRDCEIRVIYGDTDAMGIVYHVNYIKWFEKGRTEWLRQIGYTYKKMEEEGIWLPVSAVTCDYKAPAKYDDVLIIKTWIKKLKGATIIMAYEIVKAETGEICVIGTTTHPVTNPDLKPLRLKTMNPELYGIMKEELDEESQ